jgi:arabinogalactan oligomer/maltooligosaccharide transport system substrate-binding protein
MKRLGFLSIFFIAAIAISLTLSGCGGEEACVNRAEEGVVYNFDQLFTDTVELTVWLDNEDYFNALKAAFEEANPDITLRFVEVGSVDVRQRLELYSGSRQAADVVVYPHDHIGAALQSGLLAAIEGNQATDLRSRMIDSAWQTASACYNFSNNAIIDCASPTDQGTLFGAPLVGESVALFYNKTLLTQLTGSDTPPATFEALLAQAALPAFSTFLDGRPIVGLDVGNAYDMHFISTSFGFELFGPDGQDPTRANLNSQNVIDALTFFNAEVRPALGNLPSADLSGEANRTAFEAGEIPYIIDGPWSINRYLEAEVDFGVTLIPTIRGTNPTSFSGVQLASVYRQSSNPDAAFRLLAFMTSAEGLAILYREKNVLPALKDVSVVEGVSDDAFLSGISAQLNFSQPMPIIPEMGFFWSNAGSMYSNSWNGTRTPQEAADIAQQGFTSQSGIPQSED